MKECNFPIVSHSKYKLNANELLELIRTDQYFGAVICDIHVPAHLESAFAEMLPIFKNVDISINDVGSFMKKLREDLDEFKTPR